MAMFNSKLLGDQRVHSDNVAMEDGSFIYQLLWKHGEFSYGDEIARGTLEHIHIDLYF